MTFRSFLTEFFQKDDLVVYFIHLGYLWISRAYFRPLEILFDFKLEVLMMKHTWRPWSKCRTHPNPAFEFFSKIGSRKLQKTMSIAVFIRRLKSSYQQTLGRISLGVQPGFKTLDLQYFDESTLLSQTKRHHFFVAWRCLARLFFWGRNPWWTVLSAQFRPFLARQVR